MFNPLKIACATVSHDPSLSFLDHYDIVAIGVAQSEEKTGTALFHEGLAALFPQKVLLDFDAKHASHRVCYTLTGARVLLLGLGLLSELTEDRLRQAAGEASRVLSTYENPAFWLEPTTVAALGQSVTIRAVTEGCVLGSYVFDRYKSEKKNLSAKSVSLLLSDSLTPDLERAKKHAEILAQATCLSRSLANMPANDLTPSAFIQHARHLLSELPVVCETIDKEKALSLGMGSFLSVGQGSIEPSYMLVMRYSPVSGQTPLGLVGKGVTFDSGGISIKPGKGMKDMKADMTGAASVLAAVWGAASLGVSHNIVGVVALTENMPSGNALKPGDIVRAMNGKTIEIVNTDAEGRLILADALTFVCREGASPVLDMATLTGACAVALGDLACGVLGNNEALISTLRQIGERTGERVWPLPLYDGYLEMMRSDVADIANANETGKGGTCTAAKFLEQFIEGRPWAHIDIASMMISDKTKGYAVKGMSGIGARLLLGYVLAEQGF